MPLNFGFPRHTNSTVIDANHPNELQVALESLTGLPTPTEYGDFNDRVDPGAAGTAGQAPVWGPAGPVYVTSRINAAAYSSLAAALAASDGSKSVYVPPGAYSISAALTPPAGTTVEMHPNAVIEQTTATTPVFDLLDVPDVRIIGGQLDWNGSRDFTGGSARGDASMNLNAAAWTNSNGTVVEGIAPFGFHVGIVVSGWNGTALEDGHTHDARVSEVAVDTVNFGVLAFGTTNLNIHQLRGTYDMFNDVGSGAPPPHLIYFSAAGGTNGRNIAPSIADCYAGGGDTSSAYQLKGITGGGARGLHAGSVPALLNIMRTKRFRVEGGSAEATTDVADYAVSIQVVTTPTEVEGVTVRGISIGSAPGGRLATMQGTDCELVEIAANMNSSTTTSSQGHIRVYGSRNSVIRPRLREIGVGAQNGVQFWTGTGHRLEHPDMIDVQHLARVVSPATATIVYDPTRITALQTPMIRSGGEADRLQISPTRRVVNVTTAAVQLDPVAATRTSFRFTISATTIGAPNAFVAITGLMHEVEIHNDTAGAITTTWGAGIVLRSAWTDPAAGARSFITVMYDGANWVETGRSG